MSSRECCNQLGCLCLTLCAAWLAVGVLLPVGVAADEIDSIRALPTSVPSVEAESWPFECTSSNSCYSNAQVAGSECVCPANTGSGYGTVLDASGSRVAGAYVGGHFQFEPWSWQVLPEGLIFRSYLANNREPRFGLWWVHEKEQGWLWDVALGGRMGLLRYGTSDPLRPEGWELDIEGAAFPRLKLDNHRDMIAADFRFGIPLTYRRDRWEFKLAFYHLSSHLADEYILLVDPDRERINYSRDVLTLAAGYFPTENIRLYAECGWAWYADEGSDPWEFQFGIEYSPLYPNGIHGNPFLAINTRLRQEVDYGGNMSLQAGWQWRGWSGQRFRVGMQYFNGMSDQYQFVREFEEQIGGGVWYDF